MQRIVMGHGGVWVQVKPALTALVPGPCIPDDRQHLDSAVGKFDQILLQRIDTKRVLDRVGLELAVRPICLDHELVAVAKEARAHAGILEGRIVEIAPD